MKGKRRFSGQSVNEFALILPFAFLLLMGFFDLGRTVYYYSSLTNAVREGTRYAIVHRDEIEFAYDNPTNNSLQDKVLEYAIGLTEIADPLTKDDIFIDVEKAGKYFSTVSIEVSYPYKPITPLVTQLFGSSEGIDLIVRSKMQVTPGSK